MKHLTGPLIGVARGLWAALLPDPERRRFSAAHVIDAPAWSLLLGLIQLLFGAFSFFFGGVAFIFGASVLPGMTLLEKWVPGLSTTHFQGVMLVNWLAWFIHPASWPLAYLALVGLSRCVAFAVTREAVGDPLVLAATRLTQRAGTSIRERRRRRRLGPERPDRLVRGADGGLVVLTSREKAGWNEAATIEIDGRYYRVTGVEIRRDGSFEVLAYLLKEQETGRLVRRLIAYSPRESA